MSNRTFYWCCLINKDFVLILSIETLPHEGVEWRGWSGGGAGYTLGCQAANRSCNINACRMYDMYMLTQVFISIAKV